jgi:hypothetical protein
MLTQGSTTPTRAKTARVGDPGHALGYICSALRAGATQFARLVRLLQCGLRQHASPALRDEIRKPSASALGGRNWTNRVPRARHNMARTQFSAVPGGLGFLFHVYPRLKPWAILCRPAGRDWRLVGTTTDAGSGTRWAIIFRPPGRVRRVPQPLACFWRRLGKQFCTLEPSG